MTRARQLNGAELVSFIEERQAKQVRNLKQEHHILPRLVVLMRDNASRVSEVYVAMKQRYAEDIGITLDIVRVAESSLKEQIHELNNDSNVHGIIVQLPLEDASQTQAICDEIDSKKDVDGLGKGAAYTSATAEAIDWLLAGYNVELSGKKVTIIGNGKLVGQPLSALWEAQGRDVTVVDIDTADSHDIIRASDIIVTATGVPRLLKSEDVKAGAAVVDAGTATEGGVVVGDADDALRERTDVSITPVKGGVGPLTVAVLFDHVIQAAMQRIVSH